MEKVNQQSINMTIYFLCTWLFSIFLCTHFLKGIPSDTLRDQLHAPLVLLTYAAMYQGPAIIFYWLLRRMRAVALLCAVTLALLGHVLVFFDSRLYDLYAFHLNGFVWNLMITPGGIASLGADQTSKLLVGCYVSILVAVHVASLLLSVKLHWIRIPIGKIVILFLLATLTERGLYAYSRADLSGHVLERGEAMPLYQPMKMNTFLKHLGVTVKKSSRIKLEQMDGELSYPKNPLEISVVEKPLNIIMLVSESMRWDLLNPETMPNMSSFSQRAWNYTNHYSGGNGTRQGLFALFYGIHGNSWDLFLRNRQGPVLFDVLNRYNYQYFIYTSASFTYPELDQTIFSQIPHDRLIENNTGEPWQRDEANTTALVNELKKRDPSRPFFGFLFYESTHARYSFPDNAVIREDYLKELDYAGLSRDALAPQVKGLKARYENAANGIDIQLQRIVDYLEQSGDLDTTLIVITGDHGEEFMERARWGHNSAFNDWQLRVPMIVWMPGSHPKAITQRTSHMDIGPTILTRLGLKNPTRDYSMGFDLATPQNHRTVIVASWSDIGLINDHGKLVIPFKSTTQHQNLATDLYDNPVNGGSLAVKMKDIILQVLADARYYQK